MSDVIKSMHYSFLDLVQKVDGCKNYDELCNLFSGAFKLIDDSVKRFFDGNRETIHELYEAIRHNTRPYNKIVGLNIHEIFMNYSEYEQGLHEFLTKCSELRDDMNVDKLAIRKRIMDISARDPEFINKFFDPRFAEYRKMGLNDAMYNIETMIILHDEMVDHELAVKHAIGIIEENASVDYATEILDGVKIYIKSVMHFYEEIYTAIFKLYLATLKSYETREPAKLKEVVRPHEDYEKPVTERVRMDNDIFILGSSNLDGKDTVYKMGFEKSIYGFIKKLFAVKGNEIIGSEYCVHCPENYNIDDCDQEEGKSIHLKTPCKLVYIGKVKIIPDDTTSDNWNYTWTDTNFSSCDDEPTVDDSGKPVFQIL